jgi:hypothetical protein
MTFRAVISPEGGRQQERRNTADNALRYNCRTQKGTNEVTLSSPPTVGHKVLPRNSNAI